MILRQCKQCSIPIQSCEYKTLRKIWAREKFENLEILLNGLTKAWLFLTYYALCWPLVFCVRNLILALHFGSNNNNNRLWPHGSLWNGNSAKWKTYIYSQCQKWLNVFHCQNKRENKKLWYCMLCLRFVFRKWVQPNSMFNIQLFGQSSLVFYKKKTRSVTRMDFKMINTNQLSEFVSIWKYNAINVVWNEQ